MLISAGEIIKKSIQLYKQNWRFLVRYLLLLLAFTTAFVIPFVFLIGGSAVLLPIFAAGNVAILLIVGLIALTFGLLALFLGTWINAGLIQSMGKMYMGQTVGTIKEVLMEAKSVVWKSVATSLLMGLYVVGPLMAVLTLYAILTFVGQATKISTEGISGVNVLIGFLGMACMVFAVYIGIALGFSIYAAVIDRHTATESLHMSKSLVKNRWLAILWRLIAPAFFFWLVLVIPQVLLRFISLFGGRSELVLLVLDQILQFLATPLILGAGIILYMEAKKSPPSESTANLPPSI